MKKLSNYIKHNHPSGLADIINLNTGFSIEEKYLVKNWWNDHIGMRIFCDPENGNDSNDGSTWGTAVKTLQKAVSILPSVISMYSAILLPAGTTVEGANISLIQNSLPDNTNTWIPLDIIAVCDGVDDAYFTNSDERTSFSDTPLIIDTSITMLSFNLSFGNFQFLAKADDALSKNAWGMIKLTPLTDEGNYNGILGASRFLGSVDFKACVFDSGPKNRGHNYVAWGYGGMVGFVDCEFRSDSGNTSSGMWGGTFRCSEGIASIYFEEQNGGYSASFPKPFTEAVKITNYDQFLSLGYANKNGFASVWVHSVNIDNAVGKLELYVHPDYRGSVVIGDDSINYIFTGTNRGVEFIFDDATIMPTLPTSDPNVANARWNDSGTVKVSAG